MNEVEWIKQLDTRSGQARRSSPADVDVTTDVLRTIRSRRTEPSSFSLALPALFATLAGTTVALIAFQLVATMSDPFSHFLDAFNLVLQ
jgi:hypothetical protein